MEYREDNAVVFSEKIIYNTIVAWYTNNTMAVIKNYTLDILN